MQVNIYCSFICLECLFSYSYHLFTYFYLYCHCLIYLIFFLFLKYIYIFSYAPFLIFIPPPTLFSTPVPTTSTLSSSLSLLLFLPIFPGGPDIRALVDRDQDVTRYISSKCREYGYVLSYIGDEPERYGLLSSPPKREGSTQTTWVLIS